MKIIKILGFKAEALFDMLAIKLDWDEKSWKMLLTRIYVVKFAVSLISVLAMFFLFMSNIHLFSSITSQFSEWVSSSIVAFTISLILVKLVVITACILKFAFKKNVIDCLQYVCEMFASCKVSVRFLTKNSVRVSNVE